MPPRSVTWRCLGPRFAADGGGTGLSATERTRRSRDRPPFLISETRCACVRGRSYYVLRSRGGFRGFRGCEGASCASCADETLYCTFVRTRCIPGITLTIYVVGHSGSGGPLVESVSHHVTMPVTLGVVRLLRCDINTSTLDLLFFI